MTRPSLEHVENIVPLCEKLAWSTWWAWSVSSSVFTMGMFSVRRLYSHFHDFAPENMYEICITHSGWPPQSSRVFCKLSSAVWWWRHTWPQANTRIDLEIASKEPLPQIVVLAHQVPVPARRAHPQQVFDGRVRWQVEEYGLWQVRPGRFLRVRHIFCVFTPTAKRKLRAKSSSSECVRLMGKGKGVCCCYLLPQPDQLFGFPRIFPSICLNFPCISVANLSKW